MTRSAAFVNTRLTGRNTIRFYVHFSAGHYALQSTKKKNEPAAMKRAAHAEFRMKLFARPDGNG
jgi:hypothetical protein